MLEFERRLPHLESMHLANLAWSFANVSRADEFSEQRVGVRHEPLFAGIAVHSARWADDLLLIWHREGAICTN